MTNQQLRGLKPYIKFKTLFETISVNNWPEKLSGKVVGGKKREFTDAELSCIHSALLSLAYVIIEFKSNQDE